MSAALRRAVVDFFLRPWWWWAFVAILQGLNGFMLLSSRSLAPLNLMIAVGISQQGYLQSGGWRQVMCTLPLSRKDMGLIRWWSVIGIPGAVLSIAMLTPFVAVPFMKTSPPFWPVLLVLAREWGALGLVMLFAGVYRGVAARGFGGINNATSATALRRPVPWPKRVLFLVIFILGVFGVPAAYIALLVITVVVPLATMPHAILVLSGIGLVSAVYSFGRADGYTLSRPIDLRGSTKKESKPASNGISAWLVVARQQAFILSILIVMYIVMYLLTDRISAAFIKGGLSVPVLPAAFLALVGVVLPQIWIPAARVFRALPMTAGRLAIALMLMVLMPMIIGALILYGVGIYLPLSVLPFSSAFLFSLTLLNLPFSLRFGYRPVIAALGMLLILFGIVIAVVTRDIHSPIFIGIELGLAALFIAVCYTWTRYELASGLHAYRPRSTPLTSFGGGLLPR